MDKLSELLQEAKPLYIERKKRRELVKKTLFIALPVLFCSLAILPFTMNNTDNTYCQNTTTSVIEEMGFPTDDYGLLQVD